MIDRVRLPPPVHPGARVGVAALSGAVDPLRLERGCAALRQLGFEPVPAANLARRNDYLAGTDGERLEAFHRQVADPSLAAILFARGGYGVPRILPALDWELLGRFPKVYCGYSDLTPFLDQVVRRSRLAALHGPMVAADLARGLSPEEESSFLAALAGEFPRAFAVERFLVEGEAEGPLLGGCLSLLAAVVGTPYAPDLAGSILLVEDVNERPYRLDRMLTQLLLSGALAGVRGIAVGKLDLAPDEDPSSLDRLLLDRLGRLGVPVAVGLACGHTPPNLTLPLGLRSRLDSISGLTVGISSAP